MAYDAFAARILEDGILTDPWLDGAPRLSEEPVVLSGEDARALIRAAEHLAAIHQELCQLVGDAPELLEEFFGLTPFQRAMWTVSAPMWHGIARADLFFTEDGIAAAELNSDTPTGEAEAVVLNQLVRDAHPGTRDPNARLEARFVAMVAEVRRALSLEEGAIGLVYPTELTEDLSLVRLYRRWLEAAGHEVVLGSPYNLRKGPGGELLLFDTPISVVVRHYKTDWWGERISAWDDERVPDEEPLREPLELLFDAMLDRRCAVINPFGSVLTQNKRALAFFWEHLHRFSPGAQAVIQRHVPLTRRLEIMHPEQLIAERADWVLKSDYGAEGSEVVVGRAVTDEVFRATLAHARPGRWIAQRHFEARKDPRLGVINHGVFLVAGEAAGLYLRGQEGPTDERALSVPVLVQA